MTTRDPWVESAREELEALARRHADGSLDPASAQRFVVLCGRLEQARAAGLEAEVPPPWRALAEQLLTVAEEPNPSGVLARLEKALVDDEEPFGELLDGLLEVDDAVGFLVARGKQDAAEAFARHVDARVSLSPARVGPLGEVADRRLETLPSEAITRPLWETVSRAAAQAAAEALPPAVPAPDDLAHRRLVARLASLRASALREDVSDAASFAPVLVAAAAEKSSEGPAPLERDKVGVYSQGEDIFVQVELPAGQEPSGPLVVEVRAAEHVARWEALFSSTSRRAAIARLGTVEQLRERLRAAGFPLPASTARISVEVRLKERGK